MKEAIEDGADINQISIDNIDINPAEYALIEQQWDVAEALIGRGADVNSVDSRGKSLLMTAAEDDAFDFCRLLLESGADASLCDRNGHSALEYALEGDTALSNTKATDELITLLLGSGAEIRPVSLQALMSEENPDDCRYGLVKRILEGLLSEGYASGLDSVLESAILGRDPEVRRLIQEGSLQKKSAQQVLFFTAAFGDAETLQLLADQGYDIYACDKNGNAPLAIAAQSGNLSTLEYYIGQGVNLEAQNKDYETALQQAIMTDQYDAVKCLLNGGAAIAPYNTIEVPSVGLHYLTKDGFSAAAGNGNVTMMELLVENDFPLNNETMCSALLEAASSDQIVAIQYLLDRGASPELESAFTSPLLAAIGAGNLKTVKLLIASGADADGKRKDGSLLYSACSGGQYEIAKYLIDQGANVNLASTKADSALTAAILSGHMDIVELLVKHGADIALKGNDDGTTAVMIAARNCSRNILDYIAKQGVAINSQDEEGMTALMYAAENGLADNVKILLQYSPDVGLENKEGKTALDIAEEKGNKEIATLLHSLKN
ncbi:ankyrin repeat domain-containing protein [Papillibacter cinnamivorans]|uniref:ankyrin repeat domain-containing protein n=1 Tax=Papillibacter cinnamivorans TaxID=100176 RepID=UPI001356646C|nr:ankyrin repeat domain-containing protein [Papillibacter cinnamivorans]